MRAAIESNMVEIIRESGAQVCGASAVLPVLTGIVQGIHANDIAKMNNTDPVKAGADENIYFWCPFTCQSCSEDSSASRKPPHLHRDPARCIFFQSSLVGPRFGKVCGRAATRVSALIY